MINLPNDISRFEEDLKKILAYGVDKIADMSRSIDFQNGELIDRDVEYGFGAGHEKAWFDGLVN